MNEALEPTWLAVKDVAHHYGLTYESAMDAIANERFPVPTYKVGRMRVIDKEVHETFFREKREAGLLALKNNKSES